MSISCPDFNSDIISLNGQSVKFYRETSALVNRMAEAERSRELSSFTKNYPIPSF